MCANVFVINWNVCVHCTYILYSYSSPNRLKFIVTNIRLHICILFLLSRTKYERESLCLHRKSERLGQLGGSHSLLVSLIRNRCEVQYLMPPVESILQRRSTLKVGKLR